MAAVDPVVGSGSGFGGAGCGVFLAFPSGAAAHSGDAPVFHGALAGQQRELVHVAADVQRAHGGGGGNRRRNRGRAGAVGCGAADRTGAGGVFDFRGYPAALAECVSVVLHVDHSAAVLFPQSDVAAADDFAVFVVQRADWIWDFGDVALESADAVAGVCAVLWVAGMGSDSSESKKAARDD